METKSSFSSAPDLAHAVISIPASGEARNAQGITQRRDSQTGSGLGAITSRRSSYQGSSGVVGTSLELIAIRALKCSNEAFHCILLQ
jgi:hypothetical protein